MNRTGSIGSIVGPAVTMIRLPVSSERVKSAEATAATMSSGSAIRPSPWSPAASAPSAGPTTMAPRSTKVSMCARVAAFCHIPVCMAGASTTDR